jgi:hypothetical protein
MCSTNRRIWMHGSHMMMRPIPFDLAQMAVLRVVHVAVPPPVWPAPVLVSEVRAALAPSYTSTHSQTGTQRERERHAHPFLLHLLAMYAQISTHACRY